MIKSIHEVGLVGDTKLWIFYAILENKENEC